ncbi:MAG: translation initiation factor IF-2, partial [Patescibacteria group bacterium]
TDVQSSLEAIDHILRTIKSEEVGYKVVGYGVGTISDADIKNARATQAAIIGFHVGIDGSAKQSAEREGIKVQIYQTIYELVENIKSLMSELLEPEIKKNALGKIKILAIFKGGDNKSQIVGGKVTQGQAVRGALIDVMRNGILLLSGRLGQLQQNKADVGEVAEGNECGVRFDSQSKMISPIAVGDVLEIYQEEKIKRTI